MPALHRVSFFTLLSMVVAGAAHPQAQRQLPSQPVRVVTGGAGIRNDIRTRLIGQKLNGRGGHPIVIDNRTGAGGAMSASIVAKAAPRLQSFGFIPSAITP